MKPAEPPLAERREAEYPAYPEFPARILQEVDLLRGASVRGAAQVRVPALLIHSRADASVSPTTCRASMSAWARRTSRCSGSTGWITRWCVTRRDRWCSMPWWRCCRRRK